jgi:hypothetical protein
MKNHHRRHRGAEKKSSVIPLISFPFFRLPPQLKPTRMLGLFAENGDAGDEKGCAGSRGEVPGTTRRTPHHPSSPFSSFGSTRGGFGGGGFRMRATLFMKPPASPATSSGIASATASSNGWSHAVSSAAKFCST